ncbi:MAG TPA: hypothetical protein VFV19_05740 [Candidatus Polarisedimenticolaceae bacterium]|nr:hypothetical protein [Candidatus Polarisedimenticolaceae bacterium]
MSRRFLSIPLFVFFLLQLAVSANAGVAIGGYKWSSIGPAPTCCFFPGGETGRATSIAADPQDPNDIWIGTAGGGVWHSTDGGSTWAPTSDDQASLAIGAVAIAGCTAGSGCSAIYAGTGENAIRRDTYYGAGLLVGTSDMSGVHWTLSDGKPTYDFTHGSIYNVVLDRTTSGASQVLYITLSSGVTASASESTVSALEPSPGGWGIYKSLNNGGSWNKLTVPGSVIPGTGRPTDLEMDPTNASVLYAGFLGRGIFKTTDGGATWCPLDPGIPRPNGCPFTYGLPNPTTDTFDHVEIDIYRQDHLHLYASFGQCPDRLLNDCEASIYESTDGGIHWIQRYAGTTQRTFPGFDLTCPSAYTRYMHALTISPTDPATLFLGGYHLCQSNDNGRSWGQSDDNTVATSLDDFWMLHPDHHRVVFHDTATNRAYDANDGGIATSTDGGNNWTPKASGGLDTIEFQSIATSPLTTDVIGGTQDNSGMRWTGSKQWEHLKCCGDGGFSILEAYNVKNMYITSNEGDKVLPVRSLDGGGSWQDQTTFNYDIGINTLEPRSFYPPMMETVGGVILFGTTHLWNNTNVLVNFNDISPTLSSVAEPEIVGGTDAVTAVADAPSEQNRIYLGYYSGNIWVSTGACSSLGCWPVHGAGLPGAPITWIAVDPATSTTAYATVSGFGPGVHVYKTTDGGATWGPTGSTTGMNGVPANTIVADPSNGSSLLLGTDNGIYKSINGGASWYRFSAGLPNVPVYAFAIDATRSRTYAATHGRGAYVLTPVFVKSYVEGPIKKLVLDQPAFGGGYRANLGCSIKVKAASGRVCASGTLDALGGTVHTDAEGVLVSTKSGVFQDLPVVWGCTQGHCLSADAADCIENGAPPSSIEVDCGTEIATAATAAVPSSAGPPSALLTIGGAGPSPMAHAGGFQLVPAVQAGGGATHVLCSVPVSFTAGQTQSSVLHAASDAVNGDPSCAASGVTASVQEPATTGAVEDQFPHSGSLVLQAPEITGSALVPSMRTSPGQAPGACFSLSGIDDTVEGRIRSMKVRFTTAAVGAAGGTIGITERSGLGECGIIIVIPAGSNAAAVASAIAAAFQAPGIPGPNPACPSSVNARDLVADGAAVRTALASELEICVNDAGVGAYLAPTEICQTDAECDDGSPCTVDTCNPATGQCQYANVPNGTTCDDGNPCTTGTRCISGTCGTPVVCNDGNPCTIDHCSPTAGGCVFTPVVCDDANPCTTDTCAVASGACVYTPNPGAPCDDGDLCTHQDSCVTQPGNPIPTCQGTPTCADADPCTADLCDPATGACSFPPIVCDDGNPCTADACVGGVCTSSPLVGALCNDGNRCTTGDTCVSGPAGPVCVGQLAACDDSNTCTADSCDPVTGGCVHTAIPPGGVTGLVFTSKTVMTWSAVSGALHYNTYRGVFPVYDQTCFEAGDSHGDGALVSTDAAIPPPGGVFYYLVSEVSGCAESALGTDSNGTVIPNAAPCGP